MRVHYDISPKWLLLRAIYAHYKLLRFEIWLAKAKALMLVKLFFKNILHVGRIASDSSCRDTVYTRGHYGQMPD